MKIRKFQEGGPMPADPAIAGAPMGPEAAPAGAPQGGEDPLMQIANIAAQALQTQDCNAAMQACEGLLMLLEQAMGGEQAPMGEPQGEPVFKKGGKLKKRCK